LTPYAPAITTRSYYNAFGCSSPERNPIKSKILLAAPLLVDCFIVSGIVVASLDVSYGQMRNNISPSSARAKGTTRYVALLWLSPRARRPCTPLEVHEVRTTLPTTNLILPLPEWIVILIVSLFMSLATVLWFTLKKKLRRCSHGSWMNYKPPCHPTGG
jgi:hypothetical protein